LVLLAGNNGFGAIDTNGFQLRKMVDSKGMKESMAFLEINNVHIGSFGLPVQWRTTNEEFREDLSQLIDDADLFSQFGCTTCYTYILPSTDKDIFAWISEATKRLKLCAQILNEYGISLGLEFVGPYHLR